jgi:hypothetical protein
MQPGAMHATGTVEAKLRLRCTRGLFCTTMIVQPKPVGTELTCDILHVGMLLLGCRPANMSVGVMYPIALCDPAVVGFDEGWSVICPTDLEPTFVDAQFAPVFSS